MIIIKTEKRNKIKSFVNEIDIFNKNIYEILKSKSRNKLYMKIKKKWNMTRK